MCDYSSFSFIDKFPSARGAGGNAGPQPQPRAQAQAQAQPQPQAPSPAPALTVAVAVLVLGRPQAEAAAQLRYLVRAAASLGATLATKQLKSIVSSVNRLLFFSIYLLRHLGQIFTIKLESVEHGCCTNIYISADHSLIAALGENNIPSSVTPVWRPESGFQLQSRDCHSYCFHVHSKKLIS